MSNKELELIKALMLLGFLYLTRDKDNRVVAWAKRPIKYVDHWFYDSIQARNLDNIYDFEDEDIFINIQFSDKEPTEIKTLIE